MRLRKMAAGILAVAMAVVSLPQAVSASGTEEEAEKREYRCEWVDVRLDSQYKLLVANVDVNGTEMCRVRLSGIPDMMLSIEYDFNFDYDGKPYTTSYISYHILIDTHDGKKFIDLCNPKYKNGEINNGELFYKCTYVGNHGVSSAPDENGKNCYVKEYYRTMEWLGADDRYETVTLEHNSDGEAYLEFYLDSDSKYAEFLLNADTTTVLTYADVSTRCLKTEGIVPTNYHVWGYSGLLSDGTVIGCDGKYIDCDTKEVVDCDYDDRALYIRQKFNMIDNITDIPKETVSIEVDTSDPIEPDDPVELKTFTDEETGVKVVDESGALPENAEMSVRYDDKDKDHGIVSYDISFKDENGEVYDLTDAVEIWLPVPEEFRKHERDIKVYYMDINQPNRPRPIDIKGEYQDGFMVFNIPIVGEFIIADLRIIDDEGIFSEAYSPTVTDEATGISVSGAVPEGAQLIVTADTENSTDTKLFYDISLTKDGEEVQPNGTVTVKIPVPEGLQDKASELKVYHFVDGKYTDMNARLENGYLVFTTDHFSVYVVTSDNIENPDDTSGTEPAPAIPTVPSGSFQVPETTTAAATTTEAADNSTANTPVAATTTTTTTAIVATPADTNSSSGDTTQPVVSENNGSDNITADNGAADVGNDGAANDKGENPDTGSAIAIVPVIVAAAAVSFFAYKRKK